MTRGVYERKTANVAPTGSFEPMEQQIGQDHERKLSSTGPASEALEPAYVQVVDRPVSTEKMEMLKFMEDPVTIHIHTTSDKTAEPTFIVQNGMQKEFFRRGETKTVKRKFVATLASAKLTSYTQKRVRDEDGIMHDVQVPSTSLLYPFSVVTDAHPRGADWLRYALASA